MALVHLSDRAVILADGPDAETLLQNTLTPDLNLLQEGEARPGALLTPPGKILFDFLISRAGPDAFRLDCRADIAQDFIKRLIFLRVRAKVNFALLEQVLVGASWQNDSPTSESDSTSGESDSTKLADRRFPDSFPVFRHYGAALPNGTSIDDWHRLRIEHAVPESGSDYELSDAFPHDILFDQNGGTGLRKGCYVGQEVVSRMHHRGTARRRLVIAEGTADLTGRDKQVTAGGRAIGELGTIRDNKALAIVRIDRTADAMASNEPILAGDVELTLRVPAYANFRIALSGSKAD
jgi:folate-binding protein YgfZ